MLIAKRYERYESYGPRSALLREWNQSFFIVFLNVKCDLRDIFLNSYWSNNYYAKWINDRIKAISIDTIDLFRLANSSRTFDE